MFEVLRDIPLVYIHLHLCSQSVLLGVDCVRIRKPAELMRQACSPSVTLHVALYRALYDLLWHNMPDYQLEGDGKPMCLLQPSF